MKIFRGRDRMKFWLHFVFGAILGVVLGLGIFSQTSYASSTSDWEGPLTVILLGSAVVVGTLGGFYGDELWAQIHKFF